MEWMAVIGLATFGVGLRPSLILNERYHVSSLGRLGICFAISKVDLRPDLTLNDELLVFPDLGVVLITKYDPSARPKSDFFERVGG